MSRKILGKNYKKLKKRKFGKRKNFDFHNEKLAKMADMEPGKIKVLEVETVEATMLGVPHGIIAPIKEVPQEVLNDKIFTVVADELEQMKLISKTNIDILIKNLKYRLNVNLINREDI